MSAPLVSVIVPVFNGARYVAQTLESARHQTHRNLEIIVVDDGSTDDTVDALERHRPFIQYIRQENAGQGAARGAGIRRASGDYIALLDADDLWLPQKLEIQVAVAQRHPDSGLIACDGVQFEGDRIVSDRLISGALGERLRASATGEISGRFYRELIKGSGLACPAQTLIPRSVIDQVGVPPTRSDAEAEDWGYLLRIALRYPITLHRHSLVRYRYHPDSAAGPLDRRPLTWAFSQFATLKRHTMLCPPEDRAFVAAARRQLVRERARDAYRYGRRHDLAYARLFLVRLLRLSPGEPLVLLFLAAAWLPAWCDALLRAIRRAGRGDPAPRKHSSRSDGCCKSISRFYKRWASCQRRR